MKNGYLVGLACGVMMFGMAGLASADLITNGGFEFGNFEDTYGHNSMSLYPGSTAITGWTLENAEIAWEVQSTGWGVPADGYYLDLTGYHDSAPFGGISQSIATTVGQQYKLSFDLGMMDELWPGPVSVLASAGSASQTFTVNNVSQWTTVSFDFTANGTSTLVSFLGTDGTCYIGLDNVSIETINAPIPEPATLLLFGAGLLGLFCFIRKKAGK